MQPNKYVFKREKDLKKKKEKSQGKSSREEETEKAKGEEDRALSLFRDP